MRLRSGILSISILFLLTSFSSTAWSQVAVCGNLQNHFGPFDYRTATPNNKNMVERAHFTSKVETLRGGNTSITPGGDLSYTLGVFPNHPRALMAMMKLAEREKKERPRDSAHTMACWLDRAERFQPEDAMVKAIYGIYLSRKGKKQEALTKLDEALALGAPSPNIDYNIGLIYFDLGEFDKSLRSAHRAYAGGFNLPGLKAKLKRAGKWREPSDTTSGADALPAAKAPVESEVSDKSPD